MLLRQLAAFAFSRALFSAGKSIAARIPMMAMTTRSSIRVNARLTLHRPPRAVMTAFITGSSSRSYLCDVQLVRKPDTMGRTGLWCSRATFLHRLCLYTNPFAFGKNNYVTGSSAVWSGRPQPRPWAPAITNQACARILVASASATSATAPSTLFRYRARSGTRRRDCGQRISPAINQKH